MYDSQIKSKKWRNMDITFGAYFKLDELYKQLYKKYLKLIKEINKAERFTSSDIERLFLY